MSCGMRGPLVLHGQLENQTQNRSCAYYSGHGLRLEPQAHESYLQEVQVI